MNHSKLVKLKLDRVSILNRLKSSFVLPVAVKETYDSSPQNITACIENALQKKIKKFAIDNGYSFNHIFEEALRDLLKKFKHN